MGPTGLGVTRTRYLTLAEAAAYLNVTERFMRRVVSDRKVRFFKLGKFLRFDAADWMRLRSSTGWASTAAWPIGCGCPVEGYRDRAALLRVNPSA